MFCRLCTQSSRAGCMEPLAGFKSRCTTPRLCKWDSAAQSCRQMQITSGSLKAPPLACTHAINHAHATSQAAQTQRTPPHEQGCTAQTRVCCRYKGAPHEQGCEVSTNLHFNLEVFFSSLKHQVHAIGSLDRFEQFQHVGVIQQRHGLRLPRYQTLILGPRTTPLGIDFNRRLYTAHHSMIASGCNKPIRHYYRLLLTCCSLLVEVAKNTRPKAPSPIAVDRTHSCWPCTLP